MEAGWRRQGRSVKYFSFFLSVVRLDLVESVAFCNINLSMKKNIKFVLFFCLKIESFGWLWNFGSFFTHTFSVADPDPGFELFIPDSGSKRFPAFRTASKNLSILTQKIRKYEPKCSSQSRIPDPDLDFLPIPNRGSGSATLHTLLAFKIREKSFVYRTFLVNTYSTFWGAYLEKICCASLKSQLWLTER